MPQFISRNYNIKRERGLNHMFHNEKLSLSVLILLGQNKLRY